ncbi:MAG: 3-phosphoshikimate 1-carboxyvinyltransferase [Cytophagales bacterium]|nr:MAG: 3-phosphoshikimate 1-carboxyvinyltransferase [Cytophagales bacterium]
MLLAFTSKKNIDTRINYLPASKSESNRALIIQHLAQYQQQKNIAIQNLSTANDTKILKNLLENQNNITIFDAEDAGTVFRFMTAYLAITQKKTTLTGTTRMQERPIFPLVDALRQIGFDIKYTHQQGFPPIQFFENNTKKQTIIHIKANISSQFISALLMIAPLLESGLTIHLEGEVSSKPYILMTLSQMNFFGIDYSWEQNTIKIFPQIYQNNVYTVESDWSAASYWYALVIFQKNTRLFLPNLFQNSKQGDNQIVEMAALLGVKTEFVENGIFISQKEDFILPTNINFNFIDCPDLAQTIAVVCVLKGIKATFEGIESLKIKETDRIKALQNELPKIGGKMTEVKNGVFEIDNIENFDYVPTKILTYHDHRMCMAFAIAVFKFHTIEIENPDAVIKSYPEFWKDLSNIIDKK